MIFFLVIGDPAFLAAAKTVILIIMLKTTVVGMIRRGYQYILETYLIVSLFVGVLNTYSVKKLAHLSCGLSMLTN